MALATGLVEISDEDRATLSSWSCSTSIRAGLVTRAKIVLAAADGEGTSAISRRLGVSRPTVIQWRNRFASAGLPGLADAERSGRPKTVDDAAILAATLDPPPERLAVTHWSTRLLAAELGVGDATVARAWRRYGVRPWRRETFKFSTDPELEAKVRDVVGLYLDPPENAIVLRADEKSQIQALDRTAPILPLRPGLPEKATHDYKRNDTTTLFASDRQGHRRVLRPARQSRVPELHEAGRARLPPPPASRGARQLPHAQAPRSPDLAGEEPANHTALHPDLGLLAQTSSRCSSGS
jgi:transposase